MPQTTLHKQNLKTLKIHKNQLFFSGSTVGFRPSAGRHFQNKYKYLFCSVPTAVIFTTLLGLFTLNFLQVFTPDNSYAETHTDNASGAYNGTTYSLSTTVSDLNLELKNVTPAGKAVYGKQTVSVTTNAPGGYQLYMQTTGNLAGTKDGTATSDSIAALSSSGSTVTNAALDINTWGYTKTTPNEDMNTAAEQTIWNTPPSTLTQVDSTSSTATSGRDTDIYYGIKANNTLSGDNYSGTITYTTIANDAASDTLLSVSPTSGTAGQATKITITTSLMTTSTGISASDIAAKVGSYTCSSVSITSTAPLKFTCNTSTSLTAGTYAVTATISKYNKTYTKSSAYTASTPDLSGVTYMQNATTAMCTNSTTWTSSNNKEYTLKDNRDNISYKIRKLADGHCWMVTNLKLGKTSAMTLYNTDTDITDSSWTLPAGSTMSGSYTEAQIHIGTTSDCTGSNCWASSWGNYYNWTAATAGKGTNSTTSGNINVSICPKGWKLPKGEANTVDYSWAKLYSAYSSDAADFRTATNTGTGYWSGHYYNGSLNSAGSRGNWRSRTASGVKYAYVLSAYSSYVDPQSGNDKSHGYSVRCVLSST